jgi:excisionase family DNA binding protein
MTPTTTTEAPKRYLDKKDTAALLGVTTRTVDSWMRKGVLPYFRIGGKLVRFAADDIAARLNERFRIG